MTSHTRIDRIRFALKAGDVQSALSLLDQLRSESYPKALVRPLLASCHPGLDHKFLDLDLVLDLDTVLDLDLLYLASRSCL